MTDLRRPIRQTRQSAAYNYCTVEDITFGFATVKLVGDGPRLTSLPVVGGTLNVGDRAIVDYSAGTPPVVRPITVGAPDLGPALGEGLTREALIKPISTDVALNIYTTTQTFISPGVWTSLTWAKTKFDTGGFLQNGEIIIPFDGYYYFIAHISLKGFPNHLPFTTYGDSNMQASMADRIFVEMAGSSYGAFAYEQGFPIDTDLAVPVIVECAGFISAVAGEIVTVKVMQESGKSVNVAFNGDLYPRVMGFRMSRGGTYAENAVANSQSLPGQPQYVPDDADVEIDNNQGYLHITDDSQSYARAMANMTDTSDAEVTLDMEFQDVVYGCVLRIFLRASRDWYDWQTPTKGYEFYISNTGALTLFRISGGSRTMLASTSMNPSTLTHQLRFQCNGSNIRARIWLATDPEPGTWTLDVNDTGGFTDAGTLQIGLFRQNGEHIAYIDNVDVHTPT